MYVTVPRRHVRSYKVYIFLIGATRKIVLAISVRPSVHASVCQYNCCVQTTFPGDYNTYRLQSVHRYAVHVRTDRYLTIFL